MSKRKMIVQATELVTADPFNGNHVWTIMSVGGQIVISEDGSSIPPDKLVAHARGHFGTQATTFTREQLIAWYVLARIVPPDVAESWHMAFRHFLFVACPPSWSWCIGVKSVVGWMKEHAFELHVRPHLVWPCAQAVFPAT